MRFAIMLDRQTDRQTDGISPSFFSQRLNYLLTNKQCPFFGILMPFDK